MPSTTDQSTKDQARDAAGQVAGQASDKAGDVAQKAKAEIRTVTADAKDQAANVLHQSRSELRTRAGEQTKALSSTLGDLAGQLDTMADGSDDPQAAVARLAKSAASQLQDRAQRLDDGGFDGMVDDVKRFARNRPAAFLLGSVAAGFAIGRLAKHADLQQAGEHAKNAVSADSGTDDERQALSSSPSVAVGSGRSASNSPSQLGAGIEGAASGAGSVVATPTAGGQS